MLGKISLTMINFIYWSVENREAINKKTDTKSRGRYCVPGYVKLGMDAALRR